MTQIILLIAVIAIWVKLGVDFFSYSQDPGGYDYTPVNQEQEVKYTEEVFSYELNLEYRDPFLGKSTVPRNRVDKGRGVSTSKSQKKTPEPVKKTKVKWPKVGYLGEMSSTKGNRSAVILKINGEESIMSLGESISGVSVVELTSDSIVLSYMDEIKAVAK